MYKVKAGPKDLLPLIGYAYSNGKLKKISFNGERGTFYIYKFPDGRFKKMASDLHIKDYPYARMRYFGREGKLFGAPVRLLDEIKDEPEKIRDSLICTGHFLSELNNYFTKPYSQELKDYGIKLVSEEDHISEFSTDAGSNGSVLSRI